MMQNKSLHMILSNTAQNVVQENQGQGKEQSLKFLEEQAEIDLFKFKLNENETTTYTILMQNGTTALLRRNLSEAQAKMGDPTPYIVVSGIKKHDGFAEWGYGKYYFSAETAIYAFNDNVNVLSIKQKSKLLFDACEKIYRYECDNKILATECLTKWFDDFGMVVPVSNATNEQIFEKLTELQNENVLEQDEDLEL